MKRCWLCTLSCLAMLVALGCAGPAEGPAVDLQAERQALMEADQAWYETHTDLDPFLSFLDEDAVFMAPGAPIARGTGIRDSWSQMLALPGFALDWQADSAHVAETGNMGYTVGRYELTIEQNGTPVVDVGKYVTIWEKDAEGSWKVVLDCFNTDGDGSLNAL